MAITVRDCLEIGVLKDATVIAGAKGLDRIVENVTVLEFDGAKYHQSFKSILAGKEMCISAFFCFENSSTSEWKDFLDFVISQGISCIVMFYLGFVINEVPQICIQEANDNNLPLIVLPRESCIAYTDVIMPIAEAIYNDKRMHSLFISDVIWQLEQCDESIQNVQTLLNLLRNRTKFDIILTNTNFTQIVSAIKPSSYANTDVIKVVQKATVQCIPLRAVEMKINVNGDLKSIRMQPVHANKYTSMLIAVKDGDKNFEVDTVNQVTEVISLFLRVWRLGRSGMSDIEALLEGINQKKTAFRYIYVIQAKNGLPINTAIDDLTLRRIVDSTRIQVGNQSLPMAYFDDSVIIAGINLGIQPLEILRHFTKAYHITANLCLGVGKLVENRNMHKTYQYVKSALPTASKIFSKTSCFSYGQISFAHNVYTTYKGNDTKIHELLDILTPLRSNREWDKYYETMCAVYFDYRDSLKEAAYNMDIHINTLKYRLNKISDLLCLDLHEEINISRLIFALGILKIIE